MEPIKVLFFQFSSEDNCEEYNFIMNEILPKYFKKYVKFIKPSDIDQINENFDVFVYPCRDRNVVTYYGSAPVFEQVLECVIKVKPKIIIQLYDESSLEYLDNHLTLSKYCKLFLKQYKHYYHNFPENVVQIPLGYLNNFNVDLNNIKPVKERKYFWGWSGNLKNDRSEMLNNFLNYVWKGVVYSNLSLNVFETSQLYKECIFVPCGRGNFTLDCWRIYEAIVSGSIPVIVGSDEEVKNTFDYSEFPPFIHDETWYGASQKCVKLLDNYIKGDLEELQHIQNNLLTWWNNVMNSVSMKVYHVLINDFYQT